MLNRLNSSDRNESSNNSVTAQFRYFASVRQRVSAYGISFVWYLCRCWMFLWLAASTENERQQEWETKSQAIISNPLIVSTLVRDPAANLDFEYATYERERGKSAYDSFKHILSYKRGYKSSSQSFTRLLSVGTETI